MPNEIVRYLSDKTGAVLPDAYQKYLESSRNNNVDKYYLQYCSGDEVVDDYVYLFDLNISNYKTEFEEYYGRMGGKLVPFGSGVGGDIYCISLSEKNYGNVVCFSHDYLDASCDCPGAIAVISSNITEFLERLTIHI